MPLSRAPHTATTRSPDSARIVTRDIDAFWRVLDSATTVDLEARLQHDYLDPGSPGLRDFAASRIGSAFDLARDIYTHRARYDAVRSSTRRVFTAEPAIRRLFRDLESRYPAARFPDVYFVIGRFNVGGVTLPSGIVVAAEMYPDSALLPAIVAHELVHVQQSRATSNQTLLERAFTEGSADFVGELISGGNINAPAYAYGRAHEHELWTEFRRQMHGRTYIPWMYAKPDSDRPNDLGYFIGYRIAQAYYARAADKRRAIRDILRPVSVDDILRRSGYEP